MEPVLRLMPLSVFLVVYILGERDSASRDLDSKLDVLKDEISDNLQAGSTMDGLSSSSTPGEETLSAALRRQHGASRLRRYKNEGRGFASQESCKRTYTRMMTEAKEALDRMQSWVRNSAWLTGGTPICAPLKGIERACDKIENDYDGTPWELTDLIRCSIVYDAAEELCAGAGRLKDVMLQGSYLNDPRCVEKGRCSGIVKLKNRFASPQNGYADIMLNILLQSPEFGWQIGELQLHLAPVIVSKDPDLAQAFSSNSHHMVAELQQRWSLTNPGQQFHGGHHFYELSRSPSADAGQRQAAIEAMSSLYSSALAMAGCTDLANGNITAQILMSERCKCLPDIGPEVFNMNVVALHGMLPRSF